MKYNEEVIWKNPVPNSTAFSRPVSLSRKEERSVMKVETLEYMKYINNNCEINVEIGSIETKIQFETQCSMIDRKMVGLLQGATGAFCHFCTST